MPNPAPRTRPLPRRPAAVLAAALALVVVTVPFLPDRSGPDDALTPSGETAEPRQPGRVTPAVRAEIDRVVAAGRDLRRTTGRTALARAVARCATFEGERYCLGYGWTEQSEAEVARQLATPTPRSGVERTGDLEPGGMLTRAVRMRPAARARAERAELTMAARSVAKVVQVRSERRSPTKTARDYPVRSKILTSRQVRSQKETYWCGPATMQAIGWGWQQKRHNQSYWARRLRTSSAGTAITDVVRVVNNQTGYDKAKHAGPYIALDIKKFSFDEWFLLMMRHIDDYEAPVVLHPVLLQRYYPYLDDDASGHFQVGRGFDQNPGGNPQVGYFEPWDQARFDPSEPSIERVQWRSAYKSFRANQAHFQHNIGV